MPVVSADLLQLSIVKEVTPGVTPATPVFLTVPVTSESLAANATTQVSNTMNPAGQVAGSFLTNLETGGDMAAEFTLAPSIQLLIESALSEAFIAADGTPGPVPPTGAPGVSPQVADIGQEIITYTSEVRFPDPINAGQFLYQRFTNCRSNVMTLSADPENPVTINFSIMGGVPSTDTAIITGATYPVLANLEVFRGPDFLTLEFGGLSTQLPCMSTLTLNLNANLRGQKCLGTLGNKDLILGQRSPDGAGEVYYSDNSLLDALIAQTEFSLTVEMLTPGGNYWATLYPRCKLTQNPVVAQGTNTDVVNDLAFQASYDATETTAQRVWLETA